MYTAGGCGSFEDLIELLEDAVKRLPRIAGKSYDVRSNELTIGFIAVDEQLKFWFWDTTKQIRWRIE